MRRTLAAVAAAVLFAVAAPAQERPTFSARRVAKAPVIDGDLSDSAWEGAQEISGFTQRDPDEGKPATEKTTVKVVYDDDAIYFGAFMHDSGEVKTLLARRDSNLDSADLLRIAIDSQHDRQNGAAFLVNPSNVQVDMTLYNDIYDDLTWDAVWASATKIVPGGWIAEVRIPFSQLRFGEKDVHTWGINFHRWVSRKGENSRLVITPKSETGYVSRFADLTGIEGIRPRRAFEMVPYGVARNDLHSRINRDNPFAQTTDYGVDGGLDVKYGLSSSLTLTGTINPDFGQVEVDPAVINLSVFETFFPEKRPFFTEGAQIFRFGNGPAKSRWGFNFSMPTFFYSRRIGRSPQVSPSHDYGDVPGETTILGAAKVTGKVGKGWTIGVLDALTNSERGTFERTVQTETGPHALRWNQDVEPMTNYLVARATKDYGKDSRVGAMFMSVNRKLADEIEPVLRSSAYVAGVDGHTLFRDKKWIFEWQTGASLVEGSPAAIESTQRAAARYFQRPDAGHVELDPTRTSLSGWSGRMMLNKQTGKWRTNLSAQAWSPGFEINDVGFMQRTDTIATHAVLQYIDETPGKWTRERGWWVGKYQNWNFDNDLTANGIHGNAILEFKNYWYTWSWFGASGERVDDRKTRGGPVAVLPPNYVAGVGFGSDSRRKLSFEVSQEFFESDDGGFSRYSSLYLNYRPAPSLRLSVNQSLARSRAYSQYVTQVADRNYEHTYGRRYVFAELGQKTYDIGVRAEWTASSRLSFQLYLQPFVSSGDYGDYKQLVRARDDEYALYQSIAPSGGRYHVQTDTSSFSFNDPNFNFRSVRGNAVVRWEFRPGSAMYVVWNENRSDQAPIGDFSLSRDFSSLQHAPSKDVFMVKFSYWLPM